MAAPIDRRLQRIDSVPQPGSPRLVRAALLACAHVLLVAGTAWACPNCKESLADPASSGLAVGFYISILFMMSMPFLLLGGFGVYLYLLCKRQAAEQAAERAVDLGLPVAPAATQRGSHETNMAETVTA